MTGGTLVSAGFAAATTGAALMIAGVLLGQYAAVDGRAFRYRRALSAAGTAVLVVALGIVAVGIVMAFQRAHTPLS